MRKKELPIANSPLIAYLEEAYPLSIALTDASRWEWFYCNYIQLIYQNPDLFEDQPLKFYKLSMNTGFVWDADCPMLIYDRISRDMVSFFRMDIIDLICHAIDQEKYPLVYMDEYYLSYRGQFQKVHYIHESLFRGYDEEKEILKGLAYVTDNKGYSFKEFSVPFAEVREAYAAYEKSDETTNGEMRNRVAFLSHEKERIYGFNLQAVAIGLREYINAYPSEARFTELSARNLGGDYRYGMGIYEPFIEYVLRRKMTTSIIPFQLLFEHKSIMRARYEYMVENCYICSDKDVRDGLKELEQNAMLLKIAFIKYKMCKDERMLKKVIDKIQKLKECEQEVLPKFLKIVERGYVAGNVIYSRNGRWCDVQHALPTVESEDVRICYKLHVMSEKTIGYMVFSTNDKMREYCDVAKVVVEAPKRRFLFDGQNGEHAFLDIECTVGEYDVVVEIKNSEGVCCCEITSDKGQRGVLKHRIKQKSAHCFPINRVSMIHDFSYRYGVSDFRVSEIVHM